MIEVTIVYVPEVSKTVNFKKDRLCALQTLFLVVMTSESRVLQSQIKSAFIKQAQCANNK